MNETNSKAPSRTDWERVRNMKDEDIDFSDVPELGADFFANATLMQPEDWENRVTIQIEPEVLSWFQSQGESAHDQMRAALRIYADSHKK